MRIRLVSLNHEHLLRIRFRPSDKGAVEAMESIWKAPVYQIRTWAAVDETDRPLGFGAIYSWWPGVAEGIIGMSEEVLDHPLWFCRIIKGKINECMKTMNLWRIQTTVKAGMPERCRWIARMGFKKEGLMRKYSFDKSDWYLYALVKE